MKKKKKKNSKNIGSATSEILKLIFKAAQIVSVTNTKFETRLSHHTCSEATADPCVSEVGPEGTQGQLTWTRRSVN